MFLPRVAVFCLSVGAQAADSLEYVELSPRQPTTDPARIVVTEFFSYQCPHCYSFYPALHDWARELPADVLFERVPVSLGRQAWAPMARTFYILQSMGELEALDAAIFRAIHAEGERLYDKQSIAAWLRERGADAVAFAQQYESFGVNAFVQRAEQRARAHRIPSIPALAIDGRYLVPIADDGTFERQLAAVEELIAAVRAEKRKQESR